ITWNFDAIANKVVINGAAQGDTSFMLMGSKTLHIVDYNERSRPSRLLDTGIKLGLALKIEIHGGNGINFIVNGLAKREYQQATVWGGKGPDLIVAGGGQDVIHGSPGGGMLASYGQSKAILRGGDGKTVFVVCPGSKAYGGKGENTFYFGST